MNKVAVSAELKEVRIALLAITENSLGAPMRLVQAQMWDRADTQILFNAHKNNSINTTDWSKVQLNA